MLIQIFKSVIIMSVVAGILIVFLLFVKPVTRKFFSPNWQYYIWITVLIVMVFPLSIIPHNSGDIRTVQHMKEIAVGGEAAESDIRNTEFVLQKFSELSENMPQDIIDHFSVIWCFGAISIFIIKIIKYTIFCKAIYENSKKSYADFNIPKRLEIRVTQTLDAPLLIGLIKPVMFLPDMKLSETDLKYIIMHEFTHYRRHDILYKWFAIFAASIHWFNPLAYIAVKQIDMECEISCDFYVVRKLKVQEKNDYMNMILNVIEYSKSSMYSFTVKMASDKKILKRRFSMIRNKKPISKCVSVISLIMAVMILMATVFAGSIISAFAEENYVIKLSNNDSKIELVNKPFVENNIVYLPLREIMEKTGVMDNKGSGIEWNNGHIAVYLAGNENGASYVYSFQMELGSDTMKVTDPDKNYVSTAADNFSVPVLRNGATYVPFDYIDYMLCKTGGEYNIDCSVWDKNNGSSMNRPADYKNTVGRYKENL